MRKLARVTSILFPVIMVVWHSPGTADPGDLDPAFGDSGIVVLDVMDESDYPGSPAIASDGKIVVVGTHFGSTDWDFMVVRYNTDGSLDSTFSEDGMVISDYAGYRDEWYDVEIQPDDMIVAAGLASNEIDYDVCIGRYDVDGVLDPAFAVDGIFTVDLGFGSDYLVGCSLLSDGKIVGVGGSSNGSDYDCLVVRLNSDGTPDSSFSGDGMFTIDVAGIDEQLVDVAELADGKIVVSGYMESEDDSDVLIMRLLSDGTLDSSFSDDGMVITDVGGTRNWLWSMALQSNGKIVVDGSTGEIGEQDLLLIRYNPDGTLDPSFSGDGVVTMDIGGYYDGSRGVRIQDDGRLVQAANTYDGTQYDFLLLRYNCDGSLDTGFAGDGIARTDITEFEGSYYLVLQPDGKIVVTGYTWDGNDHDLAVMRYEGGVSPSLTISPPSGKYVTTQEFDVVLIAEASGVSLLGGSATLDGSDVTSLLVRNAVPGTLVTGGMTFRLPDVRAALFTPGCHMLSVELELSDESSISDTVTWEVRENNEP